MPRDSDPSSDPSPFAGDGRALSPVGAIGWACLAVIAIDALTRMSLALRPGLDRDIINGGVCAAFALSALTYGVVRMHLPTRTVADALGARRTSLLMYPLAAVLGVAMLFADAWVEGVIDRVFPPSAEVKALLAEMRIPAGTAYRALFVIVVAGISPLAEEMLFRGAIYRAVRRGRPVRTAVLVTAFAFALVHLNVLGVRPAAFMYLFGSGLALGVTRALSGSLFASLVAHATFNGVSAVSMLYDNDPDGRTPATLGLAGIGVTLGCLAAIAWVSKRSTEAQQARAADIT